MKIQIKKLSENAKIPTRGSPLAAGYDLYSTEEYVLMPLERHLFKTDIAIKVPAGHYGRIAPRSGLSLKNGITVLGGVIDADYIGNIGVILHNTNKINETIHGVFYRELNSCLIEKGQRIAQLIIEKCHEVEFQEVQELDLTSRADSGFGSTGS